ncbi:hypothetical protein LTR84_012190 [Exophiala bonariae]|uniref:SUN domain-containing protein n=1 Tax=Exophiala bonariae TaxID=1690606 RepID=A0AAV9NJ71_9EURO|nr:hypothetical protein LTR84_012190 [Exophiala bonariae]
MQSDSEHSNMEQDRPARPQTPDSSVPDDNPARFRHDRDSISGYGAGLELKSPTLTPGRLRPPSSRNRERKYSQAPKSTIEETRTLDLSSPMENPRFSNIDYSAPSRVVSPLEILEDISKVQQIFATASDFHEDDNDDDEEISPKNLRQEVPVSNLKPRMTDGITQTSDTDSDEDTANVRTEETKVLRAKIRHLSRHKHDLEKFLTNLESEAGDIREMISKQKSEVHELKMENALLSEAHAQAEKDLAFVLEKNEDLIKTHADAVFKLKAEISECTRMNDQQIKVLENTDEYLTGVRNECQQLRIQVEFLRKTNTDLQKRLKMHEVAAGDNERLFSYITRARDYQVKQDLEHLMLYDTLEQQFAMSRTRHASASSAVPVYETQTLGDFMQTLSNSHRGSFATLASLPMSAAMSAHIPVPMSPYSGIRGLKTFNISLGDVVFAIQLGIDPIKPSLSQRSRSKTIHTLQPGRRPSSVRYRPPYMSRRGTMIHSPLETIDGSFSDESDKESSQASTGSSESDTEPSQASTNGLKSSETNPTRYLRSFTERYSMPQNPSWTVYSNKDVPGSREASPTTRRRSFAQRYSKFTSLSWTPDSNRFALGLAIGDPFVASPTEAKHMEATSSSVSYHDTGSTRRRSSQFVISPTSFTTQKTEQSSVMSDFNMAKNEAEEFRSGSNSSGEFVGRSLKKFLIDFPTQQHDDSAVSTPHKTTPSTLEFSPVRTLSSCDSSPSFPEPEFVSSRYKKRNSTSSMTSMVLKSIYDHIVQVYYTPQITDIPSPTCDDYYYDDDDDDESTSLFSLGSSLDCKASPSTAATSISTPRSDAMSFSSSGSPVAPSPLALRLVTGSPTPALRAAAKSISVKPFPVGSISAKPVAASPVSTASLPSAASPNDGTSPRSVRSMATVHSVSSPRSVASPISTASPITTANSDEDRNERQMSGDTSIQAPLQNDQRHPSTSKFMTMARRRSSNPTKHFAFLKKYTHSNKAKEAAKDYQRESIASLESIPEVGAWLPAIFDRPLPSLHKFNEFYTHYTQCVTPVTDWGDFQQDVSVAEQRRLSYWAWTKIMWNIVTCLILLASIFGYMPTKGFGSMESDLMMNTSLAAYVGEKDKRESTRADAETAWDPVVKNDRAILPWIGRPHMAPIFSEVTESVNFFTMEGPSEPITETYWTTISNTKHKTITYTEIEQAEISVIQHHMETSNETCTETTTETDCTSTTTEVQEKTVTSTEVEHILLPWVRNHTSTITNTFTRTSTKTLPISFTVTKQISLLCTEPTSASGRTKVITVTDIQKSTVTETKTQTETKHQTVKETVAAACVPCTPSGSSHLQAQPQPQSQSQQSSSPSYDATARYRQINNNRHLNPADEQIMPAWSMAEPDRYANVGPGYIGLSPWLQRWWDIFRFTVEERIQSKIRG